MNWYQKTTTAQKIFLFALAILAMVIGGAGGFSAELEIGGLVVLLVLVFLQLGTLKKKKPTTL
jgi:hypothetical protein